MEELTNIEKARLGKLRKQADGFGIQYTNETSEEVLKLAIATHKEGLEDDKPKKAEAPQAGGLTEDLIMKLGQAIATSVTDANRKNNNEAAMSEGEAIDEKYIDPDDILDPPAVYFTPNIFWKLPPKKIGNQHVKLPLGPIKFLKEMGQKVQDGRGENHQYICAYTCRSKKEQAYMETHPRFNRQFFLSINDAMTNNEGAAQGRIFSRHMASMGTKTITELSPIAANLGLSLNKGMSTPELRALIAGEMTARDMQREKDQLKSYLNSQGKAHLLTT